MRELDRLTIERKYKCSIDLMERAAIAVTNAITTLYSKIGRIVVFAGPGNNGGDALAVARLLIERGFNVETFLFNPNLRLSEDCKVNKERLLAKTNVRFLEVTQQFEPPMLNPQTLVIDGLFGIGINKPLVGGFASLVKFINAANAPVVAIDMPSGLMCEDNSQNNSEHIIRATHTLTFQFPKLSLLLDGYAPFVGKLELLDIGLIDDADQQFPTRYNTLELSEVKNLVLPRNPFGHKGTFGHALLIAGKFGMAGAASLSAKACLRSGVGKVTIHTPRRNNDILQCTIPEAILSHDEDSNQFTTLPANTQQYECVGIGPGIGTHKATADALERLLTTIETPMVIDADAINIIGQRRNLLRLIPAGSILTPHVGEMRRLGSGNSEPFALLREAIELATNYKLFIILKGHHTAICTPDGSVFFNTTGNSGMATAGSGDVLTGILTSLLAQGYSPLDACKLGVYLHGLAGNHAATLLGEHAIIASDLLEHIPHAFKTVTG